MGAAEPAAGNRYATLWITNTGTAPCTLDGYGGLQLMDSNGDPLPTEVRRTADPGPAPVALSPGERAGENLHWGVVPGDGEPAGRPCEPTPASIEVMPPDDNRSVAARWPYHQVCQHGLIWESAYYPR